MKKTRRTSRVGENVRDALVQVLRSDLRDFDIGWNSISEVEVSPDLHYARVYITGLKEEDAKKTVEELRERAGQARYALGKRIHLRYTPELDFRYDETAMRALRVETLLREVMPPRSEEESESADDESTDESKDE
ncbi:MAG: 30S ribosome-binding factor RbfA [Thermoanaerobaculia bacterium]